jgi:hypothetical protein
MKCPDCSRTAMSFARSVFIIYPRHLRCRHCGAALELSPKWMSVYWISLAAAFALGAIYALLRLSVEWQRSWIFLVAWLAAAFVFGWIFWRNAVYVSKAEISEEKQPVS